VPRRYLWLLLLAVGLPVALIAAGVPIPWLTSTPEHAQAESVPDGDQEMAWIHTTTAGTTWERFVSGMKRAGLAVPGLQVDDARAFPEQTTATPEVVLRMPGRGGSLRIRWYKLTSEATAAEWVKALARRDPAPLALIGGGSSDRAAELARALNAQAEWHGDRPLLLITTATADAILAGHEEFSPDQRTWPKLIDVYDDRSFRFCFTNRQMAEAVTDFVLQDATLRPGPAVWPGFRAVPLAAGGPWVALAGLSELWADTPAPVFSLAWEDDPYSVDLCGQFKDVLFARLARAAWPERLGPRVDPTFFHQRVEFSVGGFSRPNRHEATAADTILGNLPPRGQRGLLVIPTVAPPARRVLQTLAEGQPRIGRRLVALTGDGISVNTIYRDADFAWPIRSLQIPLVMFTHNNPFGWDGPGGPTPPPGYELKPPNSTEDVLHFAELGRVAAQAAFPRPEEPPVAVRGGLVNRADALLRRLRDHAPAFFDKEGDRLGSSGEHVVVLRPNYDPVVPGRPRPDGTIEAYRRSSGGGWERTRPPLPVYQEPRAGGRAPE
jgi:hypothetical protein